MKNKTKKFDEEGVMSLLVVSLLLFVIVVLGCLALIPKVSEKYGHLVSFPGLGGYYGEAKMKKFNSSNELKEFLEKGAANSAYGSVMLGGISRQGMMFNNASKSGEIETWGLEASPSAVPDGRGGDDDYSTTNVQVAGVDEGDIVKTDGEYIYAVSGNDVVIAKAYPADNSEITARIKFNSIISGIYLNGNKLAVYGRDYDTYENYRNILPKKRNNQFTFFKVYNLSDKSNPKEERSIEFEGDYTNSRMIGDYIYFVTSNYSYYPDYNDDESPIPFILENGKIVSGGESVTGRAFPNVYYFDIPYYSYNFMTVSAIDISNSGKKINNEIYLLDSSQNNMFVSKDNIYITFVKRISEEELMMNTVKEIILPKLSEENRKRIKEIEKAENYILSPQEKIMKIGMIISAYAESLTEDEQKRLEKELKEKAKQKYEDISKELEKTIIHKIGIDGGTLKYKTAGEVPGVILNQFSMDENNGYFRIATTKNRIWSSFDDWSERESYSNLYILDAKMKVVGKVEKLAMGERIYSVRFMQNRAYLVTFEQVDPLFVIDLSNPTNPKVLGELKIPGYSSYLHPYDETTLIGLGKDSGDWNAKLKLSLFDVSSVGDPEEIDTYILEGKRSNSIALNDHKAFLFSKDKNLLVIPASYEETTIQDNTDEDSAKDKKTIMPNPSKYFRGAAVFYINKQGFKLQGKIDHSDGSNDGNYSGGYGGADSVKRSLYIEDILYTFSGKYLKINKLDDLESVDSLILSDAKSTPSLMWGSPEPISTFTK
ncbi:MAG: beta-propeller domain-containing protein [Patescibacteria group bacterium]|nr:beta-propeller domain-containing protein [Patescibacteria group bacterium]